MKVNMGLFDRMVLQRDRNNLCAARFAGTSAGAGRIVARVTRGGAGVKGFAWIPAGRAARGAFRGRLRGLPAGGPYDIELRIEDGAKGKRESLRIRDVLVGDVWILGGQSNMEGIGLIKDAAKPVSDVRSFYMHDRWATAKDPIHNLCAAVDRVHTDLNGGKRVARDPRVGTGPGVAFGQEMARRTGVPQGLIACAHGGTSMQQWDPAGKKLGSRSLYGAMLRRFRKNGGRVAGVVWYQGCSDATPKNAPLYTRRVRTLVRAMRRDFGDPRLPFVAVQIAGVFNSAWDVKAWHSIQDQQLRLPDSIARCAVVPAIDLEYDDGIHICGKDQQRLGRRLAQAMRVLCGDRKAGRPPIALRSVRGSGNRVIVTFANVMGRLQSTGKPAGFTLAAPDPILTIHRTELRGDSVILHTGIIPAKQPGLMVHYGYGLAPYCNIVDGSGRSLPIMGPLPVRR